LSNTTVRVIVGFFGIPLVVALAVAGNEVFLVFCTVVSFFCMNEFYNLFEHRDTKPSFIGRLIGGFSPHKAVFLLISSVIVVCFYYQLFNYVLILYFLTFVYLILDEVFKTVKHFEAIGTWLLSIVYISTPFGLLSLMDSSKFTSAYGYNFAIVCLVLVWISDTFAFFGGKVFGKHKLAERVSPKKTWEGSISGLLFTVIAGILIWKFYMVNLGFFKVFAMSVLIGIFAQIGDLFESYLKRSVNIKDSSNLIPGHGGFLDRFDSILFTIPALYIFLYLVSTL